MCGWLFRASGLGFGFCGFMSMFLYGFKTLRFRVVLSPLGCLAFWCRVPLKVFYWCSPKLLVAHIPGNPYKSHTTQELREPNTQADNLRRQLPAYSNRLRFRGSIGWHMPWCALHVACNLTVGRGIRPPEHNHYDTLNPKPYYV